MYLAVMLFYVTSETSAQVLNNSFMDKRMSWPDFKNPEWHTGPIKAGLVSNFKMTLQLSHK